MELERNLPTNDPNDFTFQSTDVSNESNEPSNGHLDLDLILKDLSAGSLAGIANVLSGHPFE